MEDDTLVKSSFSATIHAPIEDLEIDPGNGTQQAGFEKISAQKTSDHKIKRTYFHGIIDIFEVTNPAEIRTISNDSRFDRDFIGHGPVRNVLHLRKMLRIFSFNGRRFQPFLPRTNPNRTAAQDELWSKGAANRDLVFLSQSWSRCPAEKWVPALWEGVWMRVSATLHESYVA